ncbi:MAG: PIN domain-containing protein [Elusimicrobia bacterium]|nr:PIN domain-containing protein [Elusimicrobiota bacterium]
MRQVLVDTSVWVDFLRRGDTPEVGLLVKLIDKKLVRMTGLVQAEILSGAVSPRQFAALRDYLSAFDSLPDPPDLWPRVGAVRFRLARRGFQASIADIVIGVVAHCYRASLFTKDAHFASIAKVLPLRLVKAASH